MEAADIAIGDYWDILNRRKWSLVFPALFIVGVSILTALLWPPSYRSSATILIEDQEIPPEFVMATVTSFAETRIESIKQRIMSSTRLLEIINQYGLYRKEREQKTTEEIVEKMRENISLKPISANVRDKRGGSTPVATTIAFTLSFSGDEPRTVLSVATRLTSLYLEENLKVRERQSRETTDFLEEEMNRVGADLQALEKKIASFKQIAINELPELYHVNLQTLTALDREIDKLKEQHKSLKERESFLRSQLMAVPKTTETEERARRLEKLREQLVFLQSRYTERYPDVEKTRVEIAIIEKEMETAANEKSKTYKPADNPDYLSMAVQIENMRVEYESIHRQLSDLEKQRAEYRRRVENTPRVEQEYTALLQEKANTQAKYNDLVKKFMEARVSHGLEKEQKGERFTLIDPARLPEKPYQPNRLAIVLIGVVLGIGAGIGCMALREVTDQSVRRSEQLTLATGFQVLASIPIILTAEDTHRLRRRRLEWIIGTILTIGVGVAFVHFVIMDLDIFWAKLIRKIG